MFLTMLKKDIKIFFRLKGAALMLFLFPIVLITTLSFGLKNLMGGEPVIFGAKDKDSIVYYSIKENSKYKEGFYQFIDGIKSEVKIDFKEVSALEDVKSEVDSKDAIAFVEVQGNGFDIYTSNKGETMKAKVFKSILESLFNQYAVYETIGTINPDKLRDIVKNKYEEYVISEDLSGKRTVTSAEYYTFAELALIILQVSVIIGEMVYNEKRLNTVDRIKLSKSSEKTMMLSKVALGTIITTMQIILVYFYTTFVLKVNWGENTLKFIVLFITFGLFSSMLGAVVGLMAKNATGTSASLETIAFAICALGGCYTTRGMITSIPIINKLMYLSPIYWINTATSTMICGFKSNLYIIAIIIPIILSAFMIVLYSVIMKKRGAIVDV